MYSLKWRVVQQKRKSCARFSRQDKVLTVGTLVSVPSSGQSTKYRVLIVFCFCCTKPCVRFMEFETVCRRVGEVQERVRNIVWPNL
jgi:hypothetical protein